MSKLWLVGITLLVAIIAVAIGSSLYLPFRHPAVQSEPPLPQPLPTPSPQPSPIVTPSSPLDAALNKLVKGNIAFNNPQQMRVGETGEVEAIIASAIQADELMARLTAEGKRENASLVVSDRMAATLSGAGAFDVAPAGPQTQWISKDATTRWHWLVTPRLTGPQFLTLSLDAIITINGENGTRNVTTLTRRIEVEVARPHNEEEWFEWIRTRVDAVGWGWAILAAAAGGAIGLWRKIRGRSARTLNAPTRDPPDGERD